MRNHTLSLLRWSATTIVGEYVEDFADSDEVLREEMLKLGWFPDPLDA
jgi:hypothetical protein